MRIDDGHLPGGGGAAPRPSAPTASPVPDADLTAQADAVAEAAAEAVALVEHHRAELRAVMAELTALQREVRADLIAVAAALDELSDRTTTDPEHPGASTAPRRPWRRRRRA